MMKFHKMFKSLITLTVVAGFYIPGTREMSETKEKLFKLFTLLTVISQFANLVLVTYLIVYKWEEVRDPTLSAVAFFLFVNSIFVTVYIYVAREKFDEFLKRIDAATLALYQNPFCNKSKFSVELEKLVKQSNKYCVRYFLFMSSMSLTNSTTCLLNYWFSLTDNVQLAFQYPFKPTDFPLADLTMIYQMVTGLICVAKKCTSEGLSLIHI